MSAGLYFPLEEIFRNLVKDTLDKTSQLKSFETLIAGTIAGSMYGLILNPIASIKYHYWGHTGTGKESFISTALRMYRKGGFSPFFAGTSATVLRDLVFGGVFSTLRHDVLIKPKVDQHRKTKGGYDRFNAFIIDVMSAASATIISSPLNYVRDMHYSTPSDQKPRTIKKQLIALWEESLLEETRYKQIVLLQRKLRIGWGTGRVGCGMAVGSYLYSVCSSNV